MKIDLYNKNQRDMLFLSFAVIMEACGHGKGWEVRANEDAEDCWDVGMNCPPSENRNERFELCFTIAPEDMVQIVTVLTGRRALYYTGYEVITYINHPGTFSTWDGGEPPYTEDVFVSRHDNFVDSLFSIVDAMNGQRLAACREHLEYSLMLLEEAEDAKVINN